MERDRVPGRKMVVERDDSTCFALLFQNERKFEFGEGRERERPWYYHSTDSVSIAAVTLLCLFRP